MPHIYNEQHCVDDLINDSIRALADSAAFRAVLSSHKDQAQQLTALESKYDRQFKVAFDAIRKLVIEPALKGKPIGFTTDLGD